MSKKQVRVRCQAFLVSVGIVFCCNAAQAIAIDTVLVGNINNSWDASGSPLFMGEVSYFYRIGTTEVTNAQYTKFLNAVAATDSYELYNPSMGSETQGGIVREGSPGNYTYSVKADALGKGPNGSDYAYANKPVVYVSFWDAARFTNWLHNGQGNGGTETGAYTLNGVTGPWHDKILRNTGAKWFIPSETEWYKAAYHKNDGETGNYFDYPTGSDALPNNNPPSSDTGNSANFFGFGSGYTTGEFDFPLTDAGAYENALSPYGTFDQGGNVSEWVESYVSFHLGGIRGGSWSGVAGSYSLESTSSTFAGREKENYHRGFRVATIPEPSVQLLCAMALGSLLLLRRYPCDPHFSNRVASLGNCRSSGSLLPSAHSFLPALSGDGS